MKKNSLLCLFVITALFFSLAIFSSALDVDFDQLKTDSGFDSSWDSNDNSSSWNYSDSDYSYDRDYDNNSSRYNSNSSHYNSSKKSTSIVNLLLFIFLAFLLFAVVGSILFAMVYFAIKIAGRIGLTIFIIGFTLTFMTIIFWYAKADDVLSFLYVIDAIFVISLILFFLFKKIKKYLEFNNYVNNLYSYPRKNTTDSIKKYSIDEKEVLNDAYNIYVRIQEAWMNDCIESVSDILSDEMLNQYETQLTTMRVKHEQNVMNSFKFKGGYICSFSENDDSYKISVILKVKCKDYLINKNTKKVLRGKKYKKNYYVYKLVFLKSFNGLKTCPNCGAELQSGGGVYCPYCSSKIIVNNGNMIMIDKKMMRQR